MISQPDLSNPRYLREVGWFVSHEHSLRAAGRSYDDERLAASRELLMEILGLCGEDESWLHPMTVVSIGCSCSAELSAWPARAKVGVDPLLNVYAELGMLRDDEPGTAQTVYVVAGAEDLPLSTECTDLVICRDAIDRTLDPERAIGEIGRILRRDGLLFLTVNLEGSPTPSEPVVLSAASLASLLSSNFEIVTATHGHPPTSKKRDTSARVLARKKLKAEHVLDREEILAAYVTLMNEDSTGGC